MLCLVSLTRKINEILALSNVPKLSEHFGIRSSALMRFTRQQLPTCQFLRFPDHSDLLSMTHVAVLFVSRRVIG